MGLTSLIDWSSYGCEIIGLAHNGKTGFETAMYSMPHLIVTDIRMPLMDGLEMITKLRENKHPARFIILSGFSEFEYARRAMQLGINHYVLKPVEEAELKTSVAEIAGLVLSSYRGPEESVAELPKSAPTELIDQINAYIENHFAESITLLSLSEQFYLNPNYLSQLFKKKNRETFSQFLTRVRMEKAKQMLTVSDAKIHQICKETGYSDARYFRELFEKHTGQSPGEYRRRIRNAE